MTEEMELFELSPQQNRRWARFEGWDPGTSQVLLRLDGGLRSAALEAALWQITDRHEALRSVFRFTEGMALPFQGVAEASVVDWRCVDATAKAGEGWRESVERVAAADAARPFDPANGPMLRASLVVLAKERHALVLTLPALCADGRSLQNLVTELGTIYGGAEAELAEEPMQYLDFADWQSELLSGDEGDGDGRRFWMDYGLAEVSRVTLPFAHPEGQGTPVCRRIVLERAQASALRECAGTLERPISELVLSAWGNFLGRLTGQESFLVAVELDGRRYAELDSGIGLYAKVVPLVLDLDTKRAWSSLARDLGRKLEEIKQHQQYFLWGFDQACSVGEGFEPALAFAHRQLPPVAVYGGVEFAPERIRTLIEPVFLELVCLEGGDSIAFELLFDPARFDGSDIEGLLVEFVDFLGRRVASPEVSVGGLSLLGDGAAGALVDRLNDTRRSFPATCVHDAFTARARLLEDGGVAVVCEDGSLTYGELDRRSNQMARYLRRIGVGDEALVAICLDRTTHLMVAILGTLKAGAAYVPIDPGQPGRRLSMILEDTAPAAMLTQESYAEVMPAGGVVCLDRDWGEIGAEKDTAPRVAIHPESLAYVIFTSGSTGRPKGVAVEHRQLTNYVHAVTESLELPPGATYATVSTFGADLGNTVVYPSLVSGGTLHIVSQDTATDPQAMAEYFRRYTIDCLKIVPGHLEALQEGQGGKTLLPVRRLIVGGEASRSDWIAKLVEGAGDCRIYNHYGPSETTVGVLTTRAEVGSIDERCSTLPVGRPIGNVRAYLLDSAGQQIPAWAAGELFIGGAGVTRGYLGRSAATAERFLPDSRSPEPGGRMYRTGDLARCLPDGRVEFLGRADNQVKFHGFRIELNEIRLALNQHTAVRDCVVISTRDGHGHEVLAAYYVSKTELDFVDIRAFLQERILEETIPNAFIYLKRLPLDLNGKVNTQALPSIDEVREKARRAFVEPRTDTEKILAMIWADVLGLERVGINDNFFELGGHSLLATRILSRQREKLSFRMPLRMLFEMPTIAELATAIESSRPEAGAAPTEPDLTADASSLEDQLDALDELSDEEAEALLSSV